MPAQRAAPHVIWLAHTLLSCFQGGGLFGRGELARRSSAYRVVGDYVFLEPLVAEDPAPANEAGEAIWGWQTIAAALTGKRSPRH
jgi:hypothetical protein